MQFTCPESVTHPTTNRAQYRATALMRPTRYDHDDDAMARPSKSKALSTTLRQAERSAARRRAVWRPKLSGLRSASTVRSQDWRRRSLGQWRNYILTKGTAGAVAPPPRAQQTRRRKTASPNVFNDHKTLNSTDFTSIIDEFASTKARRV